MSLPPNRELLKELKGNKTVFVETGSWRGDAIRQAIDAGYEQVYSIDIDQANTDFCKDRFRMKTNGYENVDGCRVYLATGDSAKVIWPALVNSQAVIWLDAHAQFLEYEPEYENPYPLLLELLEIKRFGRIDNTILIDDILHLTHPDVTGWSRKTIEDSVYAINDRYKIEYIANPVKNNLMVCTI